LVFKYFEYLNTLQHWSAPLVFQCNNTFKRPTKRCQ